MCISTPQQQQFSCHSCQRCPIHSSPCCHGSFGRLHRCHHCHQIPRGIGVSVAYLLLQHRRYSTATATVTAPPATVHCRHWPTIRRQAVPSSTTTTAQSISVSIKRRCAQPAATTVTGRSGQSGWITVHATTTYRWPVGRQSSGHGWVGQC